MDIILIYGGSSLYCILTINSIENAWAYAYRNRNKLLLRYSNTDGYPSATTIKNKSVQNPKLIKNTIGV